MAILGHDVRTGLRQLRRAPGFAAITILTLALGIGATTAIFSVVDGVLLRPLPYPEADRLVMVWRTLPSLGFERAPVSYPNLAAWRAGSPGFEELGAYGVRLATLARGDGPERLRGAYATAGLFEVLGTSPALGRTFTDREDRPGGDPVVVLSHVLWTDRFGADPGILGRSIRLDDRSHTAIGVMPAGFGFPSEETAFWIPAGLMPESGDRGTNFLMAVGRLAEGVEAAAAERQVRATVDRLREAHPDLFLEGESAWMESLHTFRVGDTRPALLALLGGVGVLLLLACLNLANLQLARTASRRGELAVRSALGAGRGRLARQLLVETLILAAAGGLLAVLLGDLLLQSILALAPTSIPRLGEVHLDARVLAFTGLLVGAVTLVVGAFPALRITRTHALPALRDSTGAAGANGHRLGPRRLLVTVQTALALVLLSGAGLLIHSLDRLLAVEPGFRPEGVLSFQVALPEDRYAEASAVETFFSTLIRRSEALPGVASVGASMSVPFRPEYASSMVEIEGRPSEPEQENLVGWIPVRGDYFRTLGVELLSGRVFGPGDDAEAEEVAIINRAMAETYWPGADPIGRRFGEPGDWTRVVGVVEDVRREAIDLPAKPEAYVPHAQSAWSRNLYVVLRAAQGDPARFVQPVRELVAGLDPRLPVTNVSTLSRLAGDELTEPRFRAAVLSVFAALGTLLAAVGLYGVTSFHVSRRTREIGVRMALGATRADVLRAVMRDAALLVAAGAAVGLPAAALASRSLEALLYEVSPLDPPVLAGATAFLAVVALAAGYVPARRASAVDPVRALRHE